MKSLTSRAAIKVSAYIYTHGFKLCLYQSRILYQWIVHITHQWTAKKREKKIRWTMTKKDIHYRMYICTFLFNSTFIFFLLRLSFWTNRQAKTGRQAGMVFVIYLTCLKYNTYIYIYMHTHSIIWDKSRMMRKDIIIIILYEL